MSPARIAGKCNFAVIYPFTSKIDNKNVLFYPTQFSVTNGQTEVKDMVRNKSSTVAMNQYSSQDTNSDLNAADDSLP